MLRSAAPMNTRRQFLITAPIGRAWRGGRVRPRAAERGRSRDSQPRRARRRRSARRRRRARRLAVHVRRGGEAGAGDDERRRARDGGRRAGDARWRRCSSAAPDRARSRSSRHRAGDALEPGARRRARGPRARPLRAQRRVDAGPLPASDDDIAFAPVTQLSRWIEREEAHVGAADADLPRPHRALRSEAALRHHAHAGRSRSRRRGRPTRRSPPGSTAARCTASRTA